jgi:UDP-N-acetylenolpyruvoylglucosamine reductase
MRILVDRLTSPDNDGNRATYMELSCDKDEVNNLPTSGIANGSNVIVTDEETPAVTVKFFSEKTGKWIDP